MKFHKMDREIARWMEKHGHRLLRIALATVFIWFGALKLIPGLSPAQGLVELTVPIGAWFVQFLGVWEIVIGICLLYRPLLRWGIGLMALQMVGTFLPLVFLPSITWQAPFVPTLEGQYIIKNVVLISAAIVIGGTVGHRHRRLQE